MRSVYRFVCAAALAASVSLPALAAPVNQKAYDALLAMKGINVIVLGDYTNVGNGDIEGKAWIGGNSSGSKLQVGFGNSSQSSGSSAYQTLTVVGNLTNNGLDLYNGNVKGGKQVGTYNNAANGSYGMKVGGDVTDTNNGLNTKADGAKIRVGGVVNRMSLDYNNHDVVIDGKLGNSNFNGNGIMVKAADYAGSTNSLNGGTTVSISAPNTTGNANPPAGWIFNQSGQTLDAPKTADLQTEKTTMVTNMKELSSQLSSFGGTSATKVGAGGNSTAYDLLFNVSASAAFTSFSISATDLFSARNIGFLLNGSTAPIIVNVTGIGSGTFNWGLQKGVNGYNNIVYDQSLSSQLIWNFSDATATSLLNINTTLEGSVLDPYGRVSTASSSNIEGTLVAALFTQGGEVHLGTFNGGDPTNTAITTLSTPVPEPATWAMMVLGFGAVGGMIRGRRRQAATVSFG